MVRLWMLAATVAMVPGEAPVFSASEQKMLAAGEIVLSHDAHKLPSGNAGSSRAYAVIDAPPDAAWNLVQTYPEFLRLTPRLTAFTILEQDPAHARVAQTFTVLLQKFQFGLIVTFDDVNHALAWTLDRSQSHDIRDVEGSIRFLPWDGGRTLMIYDVRLDSGMFVPGFVENMLQEGDVPRLVSNVRDGVMARARKLATPDAGGR